MLKKNIIFMLLIFLTNTGAFAETISFNTFKSDKKLVTELQKGGYILYLRHAATQREKRKIKADMSDCSTQRNLSTEGIEFSKHLNDVLKTLSISVDKVSSSPYCRTKDTAKFAFGEFTINEGLSFTLKEETKIKAERAKVLRKMFSIHPKNGYNNAIVAHTSNLKDAIDVWPKPEGVTVIVQPVGNNGYKHVATIKPKEWDTLLKLK